MNFTEFLLIYAYVLQLTKKDDERYESEHKPEPACFYSKFV